jgi:hypothetical protein
MRQVQQLAQVLAQVLFHKRTGDIEEAQQALSEALSGTIGLDLETLRTMSKEEIAEHRSSGGALSGDLTIAVADLLREDATPEGRRRALWLYEIALSSGEVVPYDIAERIDALRASVE